MIPLFVSPITMEVDMGVPMDLPELRPSRSAVPAQSGMKMATTPVGWGGLSVLQRIEKAHAEALAAQAAKEASAGRHV